MAWVGQNEAIMPIHQTVDRLVVLMPRPRTVVLKSEVRPPTRAEGDTGSHLNLQVNEIYEDLMGMLNIDIEDIDTIQICQNDIFLTGKNEEMINKIKGTYEIEHVPEKVKIAGFDFFIEKAEPSYRNKRGDDLVIRIFGCPAEISNEAIVAKLDQYGTIAAIWSSKIRETEIKNGTRLVRMSKLVKHIPWYLTIQGFSFRAKYEGQLARGAQREQGTIQPPPAPTPNASNNREEGTTQPNPTSNASNNSGEAPQPQDPKPTTPEGNGQQGETDQASSPGSSPHSLVMDLSPPREGDFTVVKNKSKALNIQPTTEETIVATNIYSHLNVEEPRIDIDSMIRLTEQIEQTLSDARKPPKKEKTPRKSSAPKRTSVQTPTQKSPTQQLFKKPASTPKPGRMVSILRTPVERVRSLSRKRQSDADMVEGISPIKVTRTSRAKQRQSSGNEYPKWDHNLKNATQNYGAMDTGDSVPSASLGESPRRASMGSITDPKPQIEKQVKEHIS